MLCLDESSQGKDRDKIFMVKRDLGLWFLIWLRRMGIVALGILALYQYYQLYQDWQAHFDFGSLSLSDRVLEFIGYPFLISLFIWGLPWPSQTWQEAEYLRRDLSQACPHRPQP